LDVEGFSKQSYKISY